MIGFRIFQGHTTRQIDGHTGARADTRQWYFEPLDYDGDVLYSLPYPTEHAADEAAMEHEEPPHGGASPAALPQRKDARMHDDFPLLDIRDGLQACDETLAELVDLLTTVLDTSANASPPGGTEALANLAALRAQLGRVFPPALQQAIAEEQQAWEAVADRWEPSTY